MERPNNIKDSDSTTVKLLPVEEEIFSTIVQLLDLVSPDKKIQARVAGGWVRDKLLGLESADIDVVIDTMPVSLLCQLIKENHPTKVQGISYLPANPVRHKSLDNTMMIICNTHIDFVNLRADVNSTEIGTPETDAINRDLTINALFYNIRTKLVEDYTGSGLDDVKNKILRTPLAPEIIWGQDPLRIIRTARFAGKSNFTIHESLIACLNKQTIKLLLEVSPERKIIELEKILKASKPLIGLQLFFKYHMHEAVFTKDNESVWREVHRRMAWSSVKYAFNNLIEHEDQFNVSVIFYSFALLPFLVTDPEQFPFTKYGMSQKWRVNNKCANTAFDMMINALEWITILRDFDTLGDELDPAIPARIIRSLGAKWQQSYMIAQIVQTLSKLKARFEDENEVEFDLTVDPEIKARFDLLTNYLENKTLMSAFEVEPLIRTHELLYILGETSGPVAGYLNAALLDWQFRHPTGTRKECEEFMREWWKAEKPNFHYKKNKH